MPKWIWQLKPRILKAAEKHLLSYIWYFGNAGSGKWNWYLAKINSVSQSTIKRRLLKLHKMHLIAIINPHYKRRRIYRLPYWTMKVWLAKKQQYQDLTGSSQMSYIYYLLGNNILTTSILLPEDSKELLKNTGKDQISQGVALKPNGPAGGRPTERDWKAIEDYKNKSGLDFSRET